jgi:tetratricopeptide (TPR) repeat protein
LIVVALLVGSSSPAVLADDTDPDAILRAEQNFSKALKRLSAVIDANPDTDTGYAARAYAFAQMRKEDDALTDINKALELNPGSARALTSCAKLRSMQNRPNEAMKDISAALAADPKYAKAHGVRAGIQQQLGNTNVALDAVNRAIELAPSDGSLFLLRASVYTDLRKFDQASADIEAAEKLGRKNVDFYKALVACRKGDYEEAVTRWSAYISLAEEAENPSDVCVGLQNRAIAFAGSEQFDKANEDLAKAEIICGSTAELALTKAYVLSQIGNFEAGVIEYTKSIQMAPNDPRRYVQRAICYSRLAKIEHAALMLKEKLSMEPNKEAESAKGFWRKAIADYDKAIQLGEGDPRVFALRGYILGMIGKYKESIADLSKYIEQCPKNPAGYGLRADIHRKYGKEREADSDEAMVNELGGKKDEMPSTTRTVPL